LKGYVHGHQFYLELSETATDIEELEYLKLCNAQERLEKGLKFLKIK